MKNKIIEFLDKSVTSEMILKRIAFYLFLSCILLGLIFFKLNEINENLVLATEQITADYKTENEEIASDIFIEDKSEPGDTLPILDEYETASPDEPTNQIVDKGNKTEQNTEPKTEAPADSLTSDTNSSQKYSFVININSNKIHYADCTFVNRMKEENRKNIQLSKAELNDYLNNGYTLCSTCGG